MAQFARIILVPPGQEELRSAVSVEQVGMEAPACFPTSENVFALLRVTRIIFESQMANDATP